MIKRTMAFVVTLSTTAMLLGTAPAAVAQTEVFTDIPVVGTFPGGGTFQGTLDIQRFRGAGGQLVAVGDLTGTLTNSVGTVGTVTDQRVRLPVAAQATCDILHLELGPLDLNLLGLVVHLEQVVLDITAEQGPGNLLGNLLCALAGLLDQSPALGGIVGLLNNILRILG